MTTIVQHILRISDIQLDSFDPKEILSKNCIQSKQPLFRSFSRQGKGIKCVSITKVNFIKEMFLKKTKVYRCNVTRYFVCAVYCPRMCPNSLNLTTKLLYTFLQVIFVRIRMETFSRVSRNVSLPTDNECV